MPRLKSPTGQASAARLQSAPGRSTARGIGYIGMTVDKKDLDAMKSRLRGLDKKLRDEIAKKALRAWGKEVRRAARGFAWKNAERTKRQLFVKVKGYKSAVWCGVGVKTERRNKGKDAPKGRNSPLVGWKAHFMEVGWHAWPKGRSGNTERRIEGARNIRIGEGNFTTKQITVYRNGKPHTRTIKERVRTLSRSSSTGGGGRGWKRGIRGRLGVFQSQYARHYMFKAASVGRNIARRLIVASINDSVDAVKGAA